jgi:hypothetical protein
MQNLDQQNHFQQILPLKAQQIKHQTRNQFSSLEFDTSLATFINGFLSDGEAIEE